jgi:hypothetical protein
MLTLLPLSFLAASALQAFSGGDFKLADRWIGDANSDRFGHAIANAGDMNGDGIDDLLVGAPFFDTPPNYDAGRVYLLSGADRSELRGWNGNHLWASLGDQVANAGDVNGDGIADVIATAAGFGSTAPRYVEVWSGADGSVLHHFPDPQLGGLFGNSIDGAGDVNGDGFGDLIIGALKTERNGLSEAGSVYVYSGLDGTLLYQYDGAEIYAHVGVCVAGVKDVNQDGADDFAFSTLTDSLGSNIMSVRIHSGSDGSLLYKIDAPQSRDAFGHSIEVCADLNGDSIDDLLIGAHLSQVGSMAQAGAAYAVSGTDGSPIFEWYGTTAAEYLGVSIAANGDLNGDGWPDIAVGSSKYNVGSNSQAGAVSLYSSNDGHLLHRVVGFEQLLHYGLRTAVLNDSNANGTSELCLGIEFYSPPGIPHHGSVDRIEFVHYLSASSNHISASSGAIIDFYYTFPAQAAGYQYQTLVSSTGIGPVQFGVSIPLSWDPILVASAQGVYPVTVAIDLMGQLDANASAVGSCLIAPITNTALLGQTFYVAAVAHLPGQLPEFSSGAVPLTVVH